MLKDAGFTIVGEPEVTESERACRNAYGKEMDEDEFDDVDPDSDEAWFDDYDFIVSAVVSKNCPEDEFMQALDDTGTFLEVA